FFQAEDGIRDATVTGVQTCALPISRAALADGRIRFDSSSTGNRRNLLLNRVRTGRSSRSFLAVTDVKNGLPLNDRLNSSSGDMRSEERRVGKEVGARCAQ